MHRFFNPNPQNLRVGDCTVRALSRATGQNWEETYTSLCLQGFCMGDMPSANHVWGAYLSERGFKREALPNECPNCYTVAEFCRDHPSGTYVLALSGHVVCVVDGDWWDTWDSANEVVLYAWERKE